MPPSELGWFQMMRQACNAQAVLAHQRLVVRVDGGGVAGTELEHLLAHLEGLLLVVGLEHGLHRGELLVGQRLVVGDLLAFGGEDRRVGGDLEAGGLAMNCGDLPGATELRTGFWPEPAVQPNMYCSSFAFSSALTKYALRRLSSLTSGA